MRGKQGEFVPVYFYPRSLIDRPPTVSEGHLSQEQEYRNRAYACVMIAKAGRMLTLPQGTISTAQVLLHRFYFRCSMYTFKLLTVSMTCLFIATKVEETPIKLRHLFSCFDRLLKRQAGLDPTPLSEQRFGSWSDNVKELESVVLVQMGFELYVDMPHKFILHFINYLKPTPEQRHHDSDDEEAESEDEKQWDTLNQYCWNTLNDALLSPRILFQYEPSIVACAAIYWSACKLSITLPPVWWTLFDVTTHQLESCAVDLAKLYQLITGPLNYTPTDSDDNAQTNELILYAPKNRAQLITEKKQRMMESTNVSTPTSAPASTLTSASSSTAVSATSTSSSAAPMDM